MLSPCYAYNETYTPGAGYGGLHHHGRDESR
jgi:hypothetical protein